MVLGMPVICNGCGQNTTCVFAAQYRNDPHEAYICKTCYTKGLRCWVNPNGSLVVTKYQPNDFKPALLYWDEGNYVTGGDVKVNYPSTNQSRNPQKAIVGAMQQFYESTYLMEHDQLPGSVRTCRLRKKRFTVITNWVQKEYGC